MTERVGTAEYMAPEIVHLKYLGGKSDIWTIGVICYLCLSDRLPFYTSNKEALFRMIVDGNYSFESEKTKVWDVVSDEAKDFVGRLLTIDPKDRPSAEKALQHSWLASSHIGKAGTSMVLGPTEAVGRLGEQAVALSTKSALANLQKFSSSSRLRTAVKCLVASQLTLKEEKEALDGIFRELDITCNGKLSRDIVKEAYFRYFAHNLSEEELDYLFTRIDTKKNGYIDYSEFIVAAMNEKVLLSDKKLRKAFELFDKDGNGLISASDLKEAFAFFCDAEKEIDDVVIQNLIKQMDRDGDGCISYDEFVGMMLLSTDKELDVSVSEASSSNYSV